MGGWVWMGMALVQLDFLACASSEASFVPPLNSRLDGKWGFFFWVVFRGVVSSELAATRRSSTVDRATPRTTLLVKHVSVRETLSLIARPNRAIPPDLSELTGLASNPFSSIWSDL
ncbi:hypothetical protein LZ30DRAFT_380105 [Colletotrichum cereale]|nr:hypothetical protein LZ30DRAFT_380105 [Colletotrichum cereale]